MNYKVSCKNDFMTGSYFIISIPECDLDKNALYTIQADCPDFIVPFHYKSTNGMIEFVYKVGSLCKLQYFSGDLSPGEYAELWQSIIKPLLECGDWFMNPCSFVLKAEYLLYDKNKKSVKYLYIPSVNGSSGHDAFYEMAVEVSNMMTVSDAVLENKILRAIIKDFNPIEFLQMLNDHVGVLTKVPVVDATRNEQISMEISHDQAEEVSDGISDEINIDIRAEKKTETQKKERDLGGYKIFGGLGKRKKAAQQRLPHYSLLNDKSTDNPDSAVVSEPVSAIIAKQEEIIDVTQITSIMAGGPGLRYIGNAHLPPVIQIIINEGEIFTIGRFDAAVGKKQSSFEFDKKTKAVSRRHAVIERDQEGYKIIDLSSSAGTFVNNNKLLPNTPHDLETGNCVSFGNSGADYVWETC